MRIAYLITAYTDAEQLAKLVGALMTSETDFYIHIDKKVDQKPFIKEVEAISKQSGVLINFIEEKKRVNVCWGGYSQVMAQQLLIGEMLNSGIMYDWCLNLTGTDYPVWSNDNIRQFLIEQSGLVIKGYELSKLDSNVREEGAKDRIRKYWFFDINSRLFGKVIRKAAAEIQKLFHIERKLLEDSKWRFCYGGEYWALPYKVLVKVYETYMKDKELHKILKTSFVPSEFWVQTILLSSDILSDKEKETIIFPGDKYDGLGSVALLHYFVYTSAGIKVLTLEDYENIQKSDKIFIRKVRTGISDELIANINQERNYTTK